MTALFWAMESDGSGALDVHELAQGLRKLGVAMTKAQATGVTPVARTHANSPAWTLYFFLRRAFIVHGHPI
jgi:Ca2+-binding EF-hand superfamily protein